MHPPIRQADIPGYDNPGYDHGYIEYHSAINFCKKVFVFGGRADMYQNDMIYETKAFKFDGNSWTELQNLMVPRNGHRYFMKLKTCILLI